MISARIKENKKPLLLFLKISVTLIFLSIVLKRVDLSGLGRVLSDSSITLILFAIAIGVFFVIQALRWKIIVQDSSIPLIKFFYYIYLGYFVKAFVPGSMGADITKIYLFSRKYNQKVMASGLVVFCQFLGIGIQWLIAITGFFIYRSRFEPERILAMLSINWKSITLILVLVTLGILLARHFARKLNLAENVSILKSSFRNVPLLLKISLLTFILQLLAFYLVYTTMASVGLHIDYLLLCTGLALINTILVLPVSISGVGVMEYFSLVIFSDMLGFSKEKLLSAIIIGYGILAFFSLLGGVWILWRKWKSQPVL